mmetsp:Transcript_2971/g.10004  ORF Transcript_2971/g.10004 Transcript_2971/m.10004 type:complete len:257 (+) Transcript_2971:601-1371(+)
MTTAPRVTTIEITTNALAMGLASTFDLPSASLLEVDRASSASLTRAPKFCLSLAKSCCIISLAFSSLRLTAFFCFSNIQSVIFVIITPASATPTMINTMTKILPASDFGDISPYPTVVTVIAIKYTVSMNVPKSGSSFMCSNATAAAQTYAKNTNAMLLKQKFLNRLIKPGRGSPAGGAGRRFRCRLSLDPTSFVANPSIISSPFSSRTRHASRTPCSSSLAIAPYLPGASRGFVGSRGIYRIYGVRTNIRRRRIV